MSPFWYAVIAMLIGFGIGWTAGWVAGYWRGRKDEAANRTLDRQGLPPWQQ